MLVAAGGAVAGCGGGSSERPAERPTVTPRRAVLPAPGRPGLSVGLTAQEAPLLRAPVGRAAPGDPLRPWQDRVGALHPQLFRLFVDWAALQPDPARPADLDRPNDGCARGVAPCFAYRGVRDVLRAIASQQRAGHGFAAMVVLYGVPEWAAAAPAGCEDAGTEPRSRPINPVGLEAYGRLIVQLDAAARQVGARIGWWSPWNEPNGSWFISPQRASCDSGAAAVSPLAYATLARRMIAVLATLPEHPKLVVGELAGVENAGPRGLGSGEFVRALPDDVACAADVLSQHAYVRLPGQRRLPGDPVRATLDAAVARPCTRDTPLWITETGVGAPHNGELRDVTPAGLRAQCVALQRQLVAWWRDPRIQAAFQYSFREDAAFPVGLADAPLTRTYPTYDLWRAWGNRAPGDPPPALPASCRG